MSAWLQVRALLGPQSHDSQSKGLFNLACLHVLRRYVPMSAWNAGSLTK